MSEIFQVLEAEENVEVSHEVYLHLKFFIVSYAKMIVQIWTEMSDNSTSKPRHKIGKSAVEGWTSLLIN